MTVISNDLEKPTSDAGPEKMRQRSSQRIVKRKRSLRLMIKHRLKRILRPRKLVRKLWILLPLGGFIYISIVNVVLDPGDKASEWSTSELRSVNGESLTRSSVERMNQTDINRVPSDKGSAFASDNLQTADSVTLLPNSWSTANLELSTLWPYEADGTPVEPESDGSQTSDSAATAPGIKSTSTYVVNEGGSLWRTSKLFIDDEILQDKLIDNLAESGMDVNSVRAGTEFYVNDMGSEGLLVVIDKGGDTYESHIVANNVTTTVRRKSENE